MIANSEIKINKDTTYLIEALKVEGYWSSENFTITIQNKNLPLLNHIENIAKNLEIKVGKRTLLKIRLNEGAQKEDIKILSGKKELNFHIEKSPFDENKLKAVTSLSYKKNQKINLSYRNNRHSIKITYLKEGILCKSDLECWAYGDLRFPNKKLLSFLDKYANKKKLEIGDYLSLKNPELIASAFSALIDCEGSINHYQLYRKLRVRMRAKDYLEQWANLLKQNGKSVVMAAADTFRAAAIDQLQEHADKLKIKLVKHDYGSDAAAVAFDAIKHAEAKGVDVVLIDTAGRLHSNTNLVDEMKKIVKIANPDLKIFVGESITGNDCVEQATQFNEAIGIDGIILSKADIDEKGGAAISISFVTQKPILYLGTGQEYKDLKPFNAKELLASLGL